MNNIFPGSNAVTIETPVFQLVLGLDGHARSLTLKSNGEELLEPSVRVPFFASVQERPFNNETKLFHPNKRTVYLANRLRLEDGRLIVGFETAAYEAVVAVRTGKAFAAFTLEGWRVPPAAGYDSLALDAPPVAAFRLVQLPVRPRANMVDWLNSAWDARGGVAVLAADPYVQS